MAAAPRTNPWIVVSLLVCAMATWMGAGLLHVWQSADSLIPVLVSLQRWTPFYWEQDRFGMLVPLLAMPFRDPLVNLLVQGWLMSAAALLAPFMVARCLESDPGRWLVAGTVANALLLLMGRPDVRFDWLVSQPYALSIALAAGGVIAADGGSRSGAAVAIVLMVIAHWVNVAVFVIVAPLILLRRPFSPRALASAAFGFAAGTALTRLSSSHTPSTLLPLSDWPHAWSQLLVSARTSCSSQAALAALAMLLAVGAVLLWVGGDERRRVEAAAVALAVGISHWLITGTSGWVQVNLYFARYIYPSLLMLGVAAGIIAAALLRNRFRWTPGAMAVALFGLTVLVYGRPSPSALRRTIDRQFGTMTSEVVTSGATVIGGDYWAVWPAVFHANLALYRQNSGRSVYGLTYRSEATDALWTTGLHVLLAAPLGDRSVEGWMNKIGLAIDRVEHRSTLDLFVTRTGPG